tara:strand:- start:285 stop:2531 length:2247 start_codon:yes stop_codon:yes gene_type:complete
MNIPFEFNTSQFIKQGQDAELNDVVCNDLSVNGVLTYNESIVSKNKTINGDLRVFGDTSLNTLNVSGLMRPSAQILDGNIVGNDKNISGLNNITSSEGTIDTLTTTNLNTTDVSCRSLYIENVTSNSRFITMEDDFNRDIASFTQKSISGINADGVDLSMVGYGGSNTEILFSTDPDTNSYIDVANFGIGTKTPSTKLEVSGGMKGTDLTITNDLSINTLGFAKQMGINVVNDENYGFGNNVLRIAGHTNITNFTDDMTDQKTAQLVIGKVADNQYIKFKTEKTGTDIGASSIDFKNINSEDYASLNYLAFKNDDTQVGYINSAGKMRMKQLEVKIDSNDGTYMNFRDNAGDLPANDIMTFRSGVDPSEFPSAHFIDISAVGDYSAGNSEIFLSTDKTKASYIDVSFVGIRTTTPQGHLHVDCNDDDSGAGLNFIFNDKQLYIENDPNSTGNERRRIVADSVGGDILFKIICNLGTGDTRNVDVFDGNMERNPNFGVENQDFKGQRWVCRHPEIGENDSTEQAFQLRAFGSTTSQTGLFDYYYDGDAEFSGTLTQGSDKRLKENIVDANTTNLISDFQKLRFVNFNMIADKTKLKKLGVLAQDLQNIYPSAVKERKIRDDDDNEIDTRLSVKYEVLYLKSCMLVQHLLTENEAIKTRLTATDTRISELESLIASNKTSVDLSINSLDISINNLQNEITNNKTSTDISINSLENIIINNKDTIDISINTLSSQVVVNKNLLLTLVNDNT